MNPTVFKKLSRGLVIAAFLDVLVAAPGITKGKPASQGWALVSAHATILLHVLISVGVVAMAAILTIRAIRARNLTWIVLSALGLIAVVWAFVEGERYISGNYDSITTMGRLAGAILVVYGVGWFLGRRQEKRQHHTAKQS